MFTSRAFSTLESGLRSETPYVLMLDESDASFSTLESGLRSETRRCLMRRRARLRLSVPSNRAYEVKQDCANGNDMEAIYFQYPRIGPTK